METENVQSDTISEEERGSRLAAILASVEESKPIIEEETQEEETVEEEETPPTVTVDNLEEVLKSADKIRGTTQRTVAASTVGPEQEVFLAEVIKEIENLREPLAETITEHPLMGVYLTILNRLVEEYHRLDDQVDHYMATISTMVGVKLSGERSRVRDNLTQLIIERWRLLNSLLDNVNKLHGAIQKARSAKISEKSGEDMFAQYARFAEEDK